MYEEYFGLKRPPFKITPDTSLFFGGGKRRDILAALVYAVHRGEGIVKVVGEVGSGKTMLCRMLQQELPASVEIIYIANPSVSAEDILFVMAHELALPISKEASKHEVMRLMHDYLVRRHMENKQVVLFIEEAQGMPLETLEEIRLLSNLETDQYKLLQIILFGQPELDDNLAIKSIRQLRERITHSFELLPLTGEEIHQYLNFRMQEVGYTGPELISLKLAKKIQGYSGGLLRRINIIADKVLLSAFTESTHNLTTAHVMAAVKDSGFTRVKRNSNNGWPVASLVVVIVLALGFYQFQTQWLEIFVGESVFQTTEIKNSIGLVKPLPKQTEKKIETEVVEAEVVEEVDKPVEFDHQVKNADSVEALVADSSIKEMDVDIANGITANPEAIESAETTSMSEIASIPETASMPETATSITNNYAVDIGAVDTSAIGNSSIDNSANLLLDDSHWLESKISLSRAWLAGAEKKHVSIQVVTYNEAVAEEMVRFLKRRWPLDLKRTYVFKVQTGSRNIYRVFYDEFDSVPEGAQEINKLPKSIRVNSPYLNSIYKMQDTLLN